MRELVYSLSGDNNLVPFQLRWRQIVLRVKKSANVLSNIVEANSSLAFYVYHEFLSEMVKLGKLASLLKITLNVRSEKYK